MTLNSWNGDLTANGALIANSDASGGYSVVLTDGQLLIGSTGNAPVGATLTAGSNISLTNAAGSITVSSDGPGDVVGTPPSTANALARYSDTTGLSITNSTVLVSSSGQMTNASQPAFLAQLDSDVSNITGDGTDFSLGSGTPLTIIFDQGNNFVSTGTFTAPVTGRYMFTALFRIYGIDAAHTFMQGRLLTSNRIYYNNLINPAALRAASVVSNYLSLNFATVADMDFGDTCTFDFAVWSGAKTISVGSSSAATSFGGFLIC